jgi:hypothetical protein
VKEETPACLNWLNLFLYAPGKKELEEFISRIEFPKQMLLMMYRFDRFTIGTHLCSCDLILKPRLEFAKISRLYVAASIFRRFP